MRVNEPVTRAEYEIPADATLMSTTDTKGCVTYANAAFVEASGFPRESLLGQPHNIVRHPDMPPEAFADMWRTIGRGESWSALVKNRRRNGDFYWVRANATAIRRDGRTVGYLSVRTRASRDDIAAADALYRRMRAGKLPGRALRKGVLVRTGALAWMSAPKTLPVRWRLRLALAATAVVPLAAAGFAGAPAGVLAACAAAGTAAWLASVAFVDRQITRPIARILAGAQQVASGQPAEMHALDRVDEIGMLMRSINQAGLNLRALVDDVGAQASGVEDASHEIALGNQDLSSRTEQQAASLQQTAASMEQLTATVRHNADSAREASATAAAAAQAATRGSAVVGNVIATMEEIAASSRRIADIIGVVDSIAFQTNILALNAAVEAARAGEQGRGFAVVAGEVRALAHRSAEAAREIRALIAGGVDRVDAGNRRVIEAGATIESIATQAQRVTQLIAQISNATQEQSGGLGQVAQAVSHLDQATQQNAALVEQTAAASASLNDRAERLAEAVQVFRLGVPPSHAVDRRARAVPA